MDTKFLTSFMSVMTPLRVKILLTLLILLWIASQCASLVWLVLSPSNVQLGINPAQTNSASSQQAERFSMGALEKIKLFGEGETDVKGEVASAVSTEQIDASEIPNDAPVSNLPIRLTGIIGAGDSPASTAMILYQSQEQSFKLDDKLPPNDQAVLVRVLADKVIIRNAGRYESLVLYDKSQSNQSTVVGAAAATSNNTLNANTGVLDKRSDQRSVEAVKNIRELIAKRDVRNLSKILSVSLAKDANGNVQGYKVVPGENTQAFKDVGLEKGDVITAVNGIPLDNPQQASRVMAEMSNTTESELTIDRGGQKVNLLLNMGNQ